MSYTSYPTTTSTSAVPPVWRSASSIAASNFGMPIGTTVTTWMQLRPFTRRPDGFSMAARSRSRVLARARWPVGGVVACGSVGLVLMPPAPGDRQRQPARGAPAATGRVARPIVREMVEETPPPALDDRLPEPLLDAVPGDEVARPPRHLVVV